MNLFEGADPEVVGDAEKTTFIEPSTWQGYAYMAVAAVCALEDEWTAETVWEMMGTRYGDKMARLQTPDTHAMGQVLVRARRDGLCEPTERFVTAQRKERHKGPQRVWRSIRDQKG
jgi:hypothetical protein